MRSSVLTSFSTRLSDLFQGNALICLLEVNMTSILLCSRQCTCLSSQNGMVLKTMNLLSKLTSILQVYTLFCLLRVEWFRKTDLTTASFKSTRSSVFSKWIGSHNDWINLSSILLSSRRSSQSTPRGEAVL